MALVALLVTVSVALGLHQRGIAATHTEQVLDCQYAGSGAHTHDESCYDADGNLVCPLQEREYHVHDDSCYTETRELACGIEEEHQHSDECYDEEGNLTCELVEHQHSEDCYQVNRELSCGKDEVTETHTHGPGCFREVTVDGGEPEMPAQQLTAQIKERDKEGREHVVLTVAVKAPEGALPEGTKLEVKSLDATYTKALRTMAEEAVNEKRTEDEARLAVANLVTAELTFKDSDGNKIVPADKVEVRINHALVRSAKDPVLVRMVEPKYVDEEWHAEVLDEAVLVNWDEKDLTEETRDTLQVTADEVTRLAILELEQVTDEQEPAPGEETPDPTAEDELDAEAETEEVEADETPVFPAQTFQHRIADKNDVEILKVSVDAPEGAFPEGTTMEAHWLKPSEVEEAVTGAVAQEAPKREVTEIQAVDITFKSAEDEDIEPAVPITVKLTSSKIANSDTDPLLVHVDDEGAAELVDPLTTNELEKRDLSDEDDELVFESDAFSVYAIAYTVDFHWEVDGEEFVYSIQGGDAISLKELLPLLDVVDEDEIADFIPRIDTVEFSDPSLIAVAKVEEDTTAGELKEELELEPEYSSTMTEEQIAEMDAKEFVAPDWALLTLKAFDTEETLTITMTNGDVFTVRVTDARDPWGIDGRTYSIIVNRDHGNTDWHALTTTILSKGTNDRGRYFEGTNINNSDYSKKEGLDYCAVGSPVWKFEYVEGNHYRVSANGQYLQIDPNVATKEATSDNTMTLVTQPGDGSASDGTLITITKDDDGNYYFQNDKGLTLWNYGNNNGTNRFWLETETAINGAQNYGKMRLAIPEKASDDGASHKATLISAADTQPGQRIVLYQRVLQSDNTYKYYAINGQGQLVEVYPSSDSVYWQGDLSIEWTLEEVEGGYYRLKNTTTGMYLSPKGGTTPSIVHAESDYSSNPNELRISLPGKDAGNYTSTISCWDYTNFITEGLKVTRTDSAATLNVEPFATSQEFYFASRDPIVTGQLTEVDTVDSKEKGITITMYDFSGDWDNTETNRLRFMSEVLEDDKWGQGVLHQGIVRPVLGSDGFPINDSNNESLKGIFNPSGDYNGKAVTKDANHLFIQNVYDSTGYFHYSAFENFAHLEDDGNFTVYEQIGTPAAESYQDDWSAAYMNRGNFMPYNTLDLSSAKKHTYNNQTVYGNWYQSSNSDPLPDTDPRKGERLYLLKGRPTTSGATDSRDYFFGMIMEAKFMQGADGLNDRGDPTRYEFNGDDDMWIFVDGVLLLDIGGVHDAFQGYIDFQTGEIRVLPATFQTDEMFRGSETTIKRQYWNAGKFPDGTTWDHSAYPYDSDKANQYFEGETYRDFTTHDFKMFYMERGAGASNLEMQFNLLTLTESQFRVKKEMPQTQTGQIIQNEYADAVFYYEAYAKVNNSFVPVTREYLSQLKNQNKIKDNTVKYDDGKTVTWKSDSTTETKFELRPGQTAIFPAADDSIEWYVVEVEPEDGSQMLQSYEVSNDDQDPAYPDGTRSKVKAIKDRSQVTFQNRPDDDLVNELRITKKVNGTPYDKQGVENRFEYRIFLESTSGELVPYREGEYYQIDKDGNYVYFEGGVRHTQTEPRIAEHTSTNGSVNNILDGDTIIIKGLLEGTDFYVYERTATEYNNMVRDANLVEDKYVFEGTALTGAFDRKTDNTQSYNFGHPVGHLFDEPTGLGDANSGLISRYSITNYEQDKAAWGSILMSSDADVLVKNRPCHPLPIELKKNWPEEDFDMDDLKESSKVTFTIQRYKLDTRHGTVNLTGILQNPPHTGADPTYHFVKDNRTIKAVSYTDLINGSATITDLPIGEYTIICDEYVAGYDVTSTVSPATVTVEEDQTTNVTVTTSYTRQKGSLTIRKTLTGDLESHANETFTYTVHGPDGFTYTVTTLPVSQATDGVLTVQVPASQGSSNYELNTGAYVVSEVVNNTNTTGAGRSGTHTPSVQTVRVTKNEPKFADFTGSYPRKMVPVTIHTGYSPDYGSGWTEYKSNTKQFLVPAGSTMTITFTLRNCPHYSGQYPYGSTTDGNDGHLDAYGNSGTVDLPLTISVPANVNEYDYYIRSKCDKAQWVPSVKSMTYTEPSRSSAPRMLRAARSRAGSDYGNVSEVSNRPVTLPELTEQQAAKEKFVIDGNWVMTVEMSKTGFVAQIEVTNEDQTETYTYTYDPNDDNTDDAYTTGDKFWDAVLKHVQIPDEDENGNLYYYYISSVSETDVPSGMTPTFDVGSDGKTLMTNRDNPKILSVTNLIGKADVTLKKTDDKNGSLAGAKFSLTKNGVQVDLNDLTITNLESGEAVAPENFTTAGGMTITVVEVPVEGIKFVGLPNGTYVLTEEVVPDGYVVTNRETTFTISGGHVTSGATNDIITVINTPGVELPQAGGIGTSMLTVLGSGLLIVGAVSLLLRRRGSNLR